MGSNFQVIWGANQKGYLLLIFFGKMRNSVPPVPILAPFAISPLLWRRAGEKFINVFNEFKKAFTSNLRGSSKVRTTLRAYLQIGTVGGKIIMD
jgi:hypothetical protein